MYKSFEIHNFKCFQELKLDKLARINLIAGKNNVGKTALLEAIFLHGGAPNLELALKINSFRGIGITNLSDENPLISLFRNYAPSIIELSGEDTLTGYSSVRINPLTHVMLQDTLQQQDRVQGNLSGKDITKPDTIRQEKPLSSTSQINKGLMLEYKKGEESTSYRMTIDSNKNLFLDPLPPSPSFETFFYGSRVIINPQQQAELYGKLQIAGKENDVLKVLKIIEPRLKRIVSIAAAGISMLYGDIGLANLISLPLMGDGMLRLTNFVLQIANAQNGVLLIDEIENGLHYSVITNVWKAIASAAKEYNTQVFATTHSWECVLSAHEAFESSETYDSDFQLHRLDRLNDVEIKAVTYSKRSLSAAIRAGLEVR
jgi:hypothetical protein